MVELLDHIRWIKDKFKIAGGGFFMRFGDHQYTGATIAHLHAHIISGIKQGKKTEKIKVPLAYKKVQ